MTAWGHQDTKADEATGRSLWFVLIRVLFWVLATVGCLAIYAGALAFIGSVLR